METQISGWECKFDMRTVLIGNLRTIRSLDRVTEDSIKHACNFECVQYKFFFLFAEILHAHFCKHRERTR